MLFQIQQYYEPMLAVNVSIKRAITLLSLCFVVGVHAQQQLPKGFVYIDDKVSDVVLDLRYFGTDNFMGTQVDSYNKAVGIVSKKTARAFL